MFWSSQSRSESNGWTTVTDGRDPGQSGGTPLLGVGLQVNITRGGVLRLDADTLERVMEARMNRLTAGVAYRF